MHTNSVVVEERPPKVAGCSRRRDGYSNSREQPHMAESSEACTFLISSTSAPGKLWAVPPVGCMRVSSWFKHEVWRQESEPSRRPIDFPSALMSDLQVGLVNSWASACGVDDSRSQHVRPLLGTFFEFSSHMSDQTVHTYFMYPCESGSALAYFPSPLPGIMVENY